MLQSQLVTAFQQFFQQYNILVSFGRIYHLKFMQKNNLTSPPYQLNKIMVTLYSIVEKY